MGSRRLGQYSSARGTQGSRQAARRLQQQQRYSHNQQSFHF
jgi:hypothetical protein